MGRPGYRLLNSSPTDVIEFPVGPDPDSNLLAKQDKDIHLETGPGVKWDYKLSSRRTPSYVFTAPASLMQVFSDHHDNVRGSVDPFYFIFDVEASPSDALLCKKTDDFFKPEPIGMFISDGRVEQWYRFVLNLAEELTEEEIDA